MAIPVFTWEWQFDKHIGMKRPILLVAVVISVIVLLLFGGYWFLSSATESGIRNYFAGAHPFQGAKMDLSTYEKGFFKSRATSSVNYGSEEESIRLVNEIYHGPLAFTPNGMKIGTAHVITTLDIESLPEETRKEVAEIFAGKEPLVITTDASFGGNRTSNITLAAVNHDKDGSEIRFDGGTGRIEASADNSRIQGHLTIQPVSVRMDEDGSSVRIRIDQSHAQFKNASDAIALEANVGAMKFSTKEEGDQGFEIGGLEIRSSFSPAAKDSKVMLGSGTFTVPTFKVEWTEEGAAGKGSAEMKGMSIEVRSSEANGLVTTTSDYQVDSLAIASAAPDSPMPYLDELGKGMQFTAKATLPREILEDFGAFQETLNASAGAGSFASSDLSEEQAREMFQLVEKAVRKIGAGTGFEMQIRAGSPEGGSRATLAYSYQGARPLTAQKTYIEVIENSEVRVEARVPKSYFESSPEIAGQVQGILAMGAIKEDGPNYASVLALKAGQLTANGEPFPLLENFLPLLSQEIPWDAIFAGMQAGAAARADDGPGDSDSPEAGNQ